MFIAGISQALSPSYFYGLQSYGIKPAEIVKETIVPVVPPSLGNRAMDQVTVEGLMYRGSVPMFWWWSQKSDPLVFLVVDDKFAGGGAYHVAAASPSYFLLPFPVNLATIPFIPFAFASIPHDALTVTSDQLEQRDQNCSGARP